VLSKIREFFIGYKSSGETVDDVVVDIPVDVNNTITE